MVNSMTGFGSKEKEIAPFGKISVEIRSTNHKFLEIVFHLPEGFLSLEDRLKAEIEAKVKRGRITCAVNISGGKAAHIYVNKQLLKNYLSTFKHMQKEFHIKDDLSVNTLIHLPGVLSLEENAIPKASIWPHLKALANAALDEFVKMRRKEGQALHNYLKSRAQNLFADLQAIKARFKEAIKNKLGSLETDEERASFLRESDITEEIERLTFHIRNFKSKLGKSSPIGKELDFIAQEMQREANTLAAKSFDVKVSGTVVEMKSQIEKIREQVQNIE
jgi:uncharacterized protein (TIGR00255 family)